MSPCDHGPDVACVDCEHRASRDVPLEVRDGDWVVPTPQQGFEWGCCDCGLFHSVDFRVEGAAVEMRVYRDTRRTAEWRAQHPGNAWSEAERWQAVAQRLAFDYRQAVEQAALLQRVLDETRAERDRAEATRERVSFTVRCSYCGQKPCQCEERGTARAHHPNCHFGRDAECDCHVYEGK